MSQEVLPFQIGTTPLLQGFRRATVDGTAEQDGRVECAAAFLRGSEALRDWGMGERTGVRATWMWPWLFCLTYWVTLGYNWASLCSSIKWGNSIYHGGLKIHGDHAKTVCSKLKGNHLQTTEKVRNCIPGQERSLLCFVWCLMLYFGFSHLLDFENPFYVFLF